MPERDVSPATSTGRRILATQYADRDPQLRADVIAAEHEAAAIERRRTVERITALTVERGLTHLVGALDHADLVVKQSDLDAILDELSPPSSDRGA